MESLKKLPYSRLMCNTDVNMDTERKRNLRQDVAKSKSGTWGPTHSQDSDDNEDSSVGPHTPVAASPPNSSREKGLQGGAKLRIKRKAQGYPYFMVYGIVHQKHGMSTLIQLVNRAIVVEERKEEKRHGMLAHPPSQNLNLPPAKLVLCRQPLPCRERVLEPLASLLASRVKREC